MCSSSIRVARYSSYIASFSREDRLCCRIRIAKNLQSPALLASLIRLVVSCLAVVPDDLEASNHLADGEEAQGFSEDDAGGGQLGGTEIAQVLDGGLGRGDGAGLEAAEDGLVVSLEGGDGAVVSLDLEQSRVWVKPRVERE